MKPEINVTNCTFDHGSAVIMNFYDRNVVDELDSDIEYAQRNTTNTELFWALNELKSAVDAQNRPRMSKVICDFATQFSSSLFANVAGVALKILVGSLLP